MSYIKNDMYARGRDAVNSWVYAHGWEPSTEWIDNNIMVWDDDEGAYYIITYIGVAESLEELERCWDNYRINDHEFCKLIGSFVSELGGKMRTGDIRSKGVGLARVAQEDRAVLRCESDWVRKGAN